MGQLFIADEFLSNSSEHAYLFRNYYGRLVDDGEGSVMHGYDTIAHPEKSYKSVRISEGAFWGYVIKGQIKLNIFGGHHPVKAGQWFSTKSGISLTVCRDTQILLIQKKDYPGIDTISEVEPHGRLKYIDGCSDTLLFNPIKFGDPCLNVLYMPQGVNQTMHTHPSSRMGCVFSGTGNAVTPEKELPLIEGTIFYLRTEQAHKFRTDRSGQYMKIIAYHPDSDFGPRDEEHPMINRTIVEGVSAKHIESIQTKEIYSGDGQ